jgi:hypothetical protein
MSPLELRRIAEQARLAKEREEEAARFSKEKQDIAYELERARRAIRDLDAKLGKAR